jgi:hypothetical protein
VLTIWERDVELEKTALPNCLLFPWNAALPCFEVKYASLILQRLSEETEGVVFAPLFAVLRLLELRSLD